MAYIGSRTARVGVGASLSLNAKIWESDTLPGEMVLSWDDIGSEPSAGYTQKSLANYTPSLSLFVDDGVASVGAVAINADTITFSLDDGEVLEKNRYYGTVTLENTVDTTETIEAFLISFEVFDEYQIDVPPLSSTQVKSILAVGDSVPEAVLKRCIDRAQNRMLQWMSPPSINYCRNYGWANRAIREGEYLASKLLALELYPDNENIRQDIADCEAVIKGLRFDSDDDMIPDTLGAGGVIKFVRTC